MPMWTADGQFAVDPQEPCPAATGRLLRSRSLPGGPTAVGHRGQMSAGLGSIRWLRERKASRPGANVAITPSLDAKRFVPRLQRVYELNPGVTVL